LAKQFQRRRFFNSSQSEKKLLLAAIKSSPLKLLSPIEPNLAGSIYVRYSIKLLHMVPFGQQNGHQEQFFLANQKKELLLAAIFVGKTERNEEIL
jgi:valyl-tRNA synthetase